MKELDLEKAEELDVKLPTSTGSLKSKSIPEKKKIHVIDHTKAFDYVDHKILWKILTEMGISMQLTCLLRNLLYTGQEATVRTRHETTDWFKIGKGVCQYCHLAYFTFFFNFILFLNFT